jgi:hypothetical protein
MAIELSTLMFTEQDDVVPQPGAEQIVNLGIANTLGGDDIITGTGGQIQLSQLWHAQYRRW